MFGRLKRWLIRKVILGTIKNAAEGKYGPRVKAIYWWLEGKKTITGVFFWGIAGGLGEIAPTECDWCAPVGAFLVVAGGILIQAGLLDEAIRSEPPKKE